MYTGSRKSGGRRGFSADNLASMAVLVNLVLSKIED
jgi:hypothetical protein